MILVYFHYLSPVRKDTIRSYGISFIARNFQPRTGFSQRLMETNQFGGSCPMIKQLKEDIEAVFARDPAARNTLKKF